MKLLKYDKINIINNEKGGKPVTSSTLEKKTILRFKKNSHLFLKYEERVYCTVVYELL